MTLFQELFREVTDYTPWLLAISDARGVYTQARGAWAEVLGHAPEEIVGAHWLALVHPDDQEGAIEAARACFASSILTECESRYRHRDGSWHRVRWFGAFDAERQRGFAVGRVVSAVALPTTQRVPVSMLRGSGEVIRWASDTAERLTGVPLVGRRIGEVLPALRECWAVGCERGVLVEVSHASGPRWCHVQICDDGEAWMVMIRDETAQRESQRQSRNAQELRAELLHALARGLAHDLNNLVGSVIGNAELLGFGALDDMQRGCVEDICAAGRGLARVTLQLVALTGPRHAQLRPVVLDSMCAAVVSEIERLVRPCVALSFSASDVSAMVLADQALLRSALMEFVINATEAVGAREGGGAVSVSLEHTTSPVVRAESALPLGMPRRCPSVVLRVRDDGAGMDARTRARAFEPFFTTKERGRGLGLSTALGVLMAHDASVALWSRPGEGVELSVFLQVAPEGALVEEVDEIALASAAVEARALESPCAATPDRPRGGEVWCLHEHREGRRLRQRQLESLSIESRAFASLDALLAAVAEGEDVRALVVDCESLGDDVRGALHRLESALPGVHLVLCADTSVAVPPHVRVLLKPVIVDMLAGVFD